MTKNVKDKKMNKSLKELFSYFHDNIQLINSSKLFAGLMIITLNIASRFVTIKLSKSMESYLKFTFSKQILVFAIAWMGTRDIYIAFAITVIFIILMDFILNEDSAFCCLPEEFSSYHIDLLDNEEMNKEKVSSEDISKAKIILEKAKLQNKIDEKEYDETMK